MARVYSARLAEGTVDESEVVAYTVPATMKAVALDMEALNVGADLAELRMSLRPLGGPTVVLWSTGNTAPDFPTPWQGRLVLNAGDSVVLWSDGQYNYAISGYLFLV